MKEHRVAVVPAEKEIFEHRTVLQVGIIGVGFAVGQAVHVEVEHAQTVFGPRHGPPRPGALDPGAVERHHSGQRTGLRVLRISQIGRKAPRLAVGLHVEHRDTRIGRRSRSQADIHRNLRLLFQLALPIRHKILRLGHAGPDQQLVDAGARHRPKFVPLRRNELHAALQEAGFVEFMPPDHGPSVADAGHAGSLGFPRVFGHLPCQLAVRYGSPVLLERHQKAHFVAPTVRAVGPVGRHEQPVSVRLVHLSLSGSRRDGKNSQHRCKQ